MTEGRLAGVRAERDQGSPAECACPPGRNAAPHGHGKPHGTGAGSVRSYCSLGEICGVLRQVFGEYRGRQW